MSGALVDTSVLVDFLRGHHDAAALLESERAKAPLHASEITRLELIAGMRAPEESVTRTLFTAFVWHPVDDGIAEIAGELGRRWLPSHRGIDSADLAIAATAVLGDLSLQTLNVKHFPMFPELRAPY